MYVGEWVDGGQVFQLFLLGFIVECKDIGVSIDYYGVCGKRLYLYQGMENFGLCYYGVDGVQINQNCQMWIGQEEVGDQVGKQLE